MGNVLADHAAKVSGSAVILRAKAIPRKLLSGDDVKDVHISLGSAEHNDLIVMSCSFADP
jgi:hypothetical protein